MNEELTQAEQQELWQRLRKAELDCSRAIAYQECLNTISAHVLHYHGQKQGYDIDHYWSNDRDDLMYSFGHRSKASVVRYFHGMNQMMREAKTRYFAEKYPDRIQNTPEFDGVGDYCIHAIFCPHIQVAGDGKTAVGCFHAPAICSELGVTGKQEPSGEWGGYGVNFRLETDGRWRIWQIQQLGGGGFDIGEDVIDNTDRPNPPYPPVAEELRAARGEEPITPEPNFTARDRGPLTRYRVAAIEPEMQEPYDTWDDSLTYLRDYAVHEYYADKEGK